MPAPVRRVPRRVPAAPDDLDLIVRYFASGGRLYHDIHSPSRLVELVFFGGRSLRAFWLEGRDAVQRVVPPRAFALMDAEFGPGGDARQFEHWPLAARRELDDLLRESDT